MKLLLVGLLVVAQMATQAQHNFLGKTRVDIVGFYTLESDFAVKTKHVSDTKLVLTAKGEAPYPYFTYEIDTERDECISVGIVSKTPEVLQHYQDLLAFWGKLIEKDEDTHTEVFRVEGERGNYLYTLSQPYKYSQEHVSRQKIFYILVSKDDRSLHAAK